MGSEVIIGSVASITDFISLHTRAIRAILDHTLTGKYKGSFLIKD